MFVQERVFITEISKYLNSLILDGWKVVSYTIKDDTRTLDVVHVIVEVSK